MMSCVLAVHAGAETAPEETPAPEQKAQLLLMEEQVAELEWKTMELPVVKAADGAETSYVVVVEGKLKARDSTLLQEDSAIKLKRGGRFKLELPLVSKMFTRTLRVVGPYGDVKIQKLGIFTPDYDLLEKPKTPEPEGEKKEEGVKYSMAPSLGFTYLAYTEDFGRARIADFSQFAVTGKVSVIRQLRKYWDLGVTSYLTLLPLSTSVPNTEARFFGLNLRVGYVVPSIQQPWRLVVMTGVYYTTMIVSADRFGFKNLMGPQLYPVLQRTLNRKQSTAIYFKFSPVGGGFALKSLSDREIAGGASWTVKLRNENSLSIQLDIANLNLDDGTRKASSTSFSLGVSYGF